MRMSEKCRNDNKNNNKDNNYDNPLTFRHTEEDKNSCLLFCVLNSEKNLHP